MADDDLPESKWEEALDFLGVTESDIWEDVDQRVTKELDKKAKQVEASWKGASPEDTGDYKDSFQIRDIRSPDGEPGRRVSNYSDHAHLVEYGSEDSKAHGTRAKVATRFKNQGPYTVQGATDA